jgi:kynurenine formamidase
LGNPEDILQKSAVKVWGNDVELVDLTQPFSGETPTWPYGAENVQVVRLRSHARDRVLTQKLCTTMHMSTHIDAPLHVEEGYPAIDAMPLDRYMGEGVVVALPKDAWAVITPADLESVDPPIEEGDIVVINTGWHRYFGDRIKYFCYAPGLYREAAQWLLKRRVKGVGVDLPATDHPLGTRLVQGKPPLAPWLAEGYKERTGREVTDDFPYWEPAHRILYTHGIFGCENVGGEVDRVTGKRCVIIGFPIKWIGGDASLVRLVAVVPK